MKIYLLTSLICLFLAIILMISMKSKMEKEKLSPFECGFDPYLGPRVPFSIRFFKIILIFLLFDVEIIIILPLPYNSFQESFSLLIMTIIISLIYFGLMFEWKEGSLEWI